MKRPLSSSAFCDTHSVPAQSTSFSGFARAGKRKNNTNLDTSFCFMSPWGACGSCSRVLAPRFATRAWRARALSCLTCKEAMAGLQVPGDKPPPPLSFHPSPHTFSSSAHNPLCPAPEPSAPPTAQIPWTPLEPRTCRPFLKSLLTFPIPSPGTRPLFLHSRRQLLISFLPGHCAHTSTAGGWTHAHRAPGARASSGRFGMP